MEYLGFLCYGTIKDLNFQKTFENQDVYSSARAQVMTDPLQALRDVLGPLETGELKELLERAENDVSKAVNLHYDDQAAKAAKSVLSSQGQGLLQGSTSTQPPKVSERKRPTSSILDFGTKRPATEKTGIQKTSPTAQASGPSGSSAPLAERMRPQSLEDLVGQEEALGAVLRQAVQDNWELGIGSVRFPRRCRVERQTNEFHIFQS